MTHPYSLSRKEGWRRFADTPARVRPEHLSVAKLRGLSESALEGYCEQRADWHANFGTIATPQVLEVCEELDLIVDSNRQDGDRVRGAAALDGEPGLGKTTIVNLFGRQIDRRDRMRLSERTEDGNERIPVVRVGLTSNTTLRTLNQMIAEFYGPVPRSRPSAADYARIALDRVLSCSTRVGLIDDVHFLDLRSRDGIAVNNHLKWLANELPITFVFAGVGLEERRFFEEGLVGDSVALAQTARRWTRLAVEGFKPNDAAWEKLVKAIEAHLVLARARRGDLTGLSPYLYERTGGHIGSLTTLTTRACMRAVRSGTERISRDLLDSVRIDEAAEKKRRRRKQGPATEGTDGGAS